MEYKCKFCSGSKSIKWTLQMHYLKLHYYCEECDSKFESRNETLEHQKVHHGKTFQCEVCFKLFFCGGYLNSHMVVHDGKADKEDKIKYHCDICEFTTKHRQSLEDHNIAIHLQKKDLSCFQCDFKTGIKANLNKHVRKRHQEQPLIKCDKCDYSFRGIPSDLKKHQRIHDENRKKVKCEHCSKEFLSQGYLNFHIKHFHKGKKYKCEVCGKEARTVTMHNIHLKSHLAIENQLKCDQCNTFVTHSKYKLAFHKKTNHKTGNPLQKCTVCKEEFKSFSDHRKHMHENHKGVRTACDFCTEDFSDIWTWKMHLLRTHFVCHKCEIKSSSEEDMLQHLKEVHDIEHKCNLCSKLYFERKHLLRHQKTTHEGNRPERRYPCDKCDYIARVPSQLKNHKEQKHARKTIYKCDMCNHETSYKSHAQRHMNTVHHKENLPVLTCDICGYETVHTNNFKAHMNTVHTEKQFQCEDCNQMFTTKYGLAGHVKSYHGNEILNCHKCDFETNRKFDLDVHLNQHERLELKVCEICDYSTTNKYVFKTHQLKHQESQPTFKCDECDKQLSTKEGIRAHKNTVHKNIKKRKVPCNLCGKELSSNKRLSIHLSRTHFHCSTCDRSFKSSTRVLDHLKSEHDREFKCGICSSRQFCAGSLRQHINTAHDPGTDK